MTKLPEWPVWKWWQIVRHLRFNHRRRRVNKAARKEKEHYDRVSYTPATGG